MGMFDCYQPVPALICQCGATLDGWQGKHGACELLTWTQGQPQAEIHPAMSGRSDARLPDGELGICTQCEACRAWTDADCIVVNGLWTETRVVNVGMT